MRIDWDVPLTVDDGLVLRADVFRPAGPGTYPVILSYGPYGKWLHFDYVPGESDIRYGSADYTGRLCVIGTGIHEGALKELFGL